MRKILMILILIGALLVGSRGYTAPILSAGPGYSSFPAVTVAGDPGGYTSGIQAFDYDEAGNLYIFSANQIIKNPDKTPEVLFNYQTSAPIYGSFIKVRGETVYFGESSNGTVRSISTSGGRSSRLFSIPNFQRVLPELRSGTDFILTGNFECDFNSHSQMFLSANPGGFSAENKIYYWDKQTDPVVIADMGGYSGPLAFAQNDDLYYGFTGFPPGPEDVVYFTASQLASAIASGIPLSSSDWTVYATDVDACSGMAFDRNTPVQNLYTSSTLDTVTAISGAGGTFPFSSADSPSIMRFIPGNTNFQSFIPAGGKLAVLTTDWLDYSSTIFLVEPCAQNIILGSGDYGDTGRSDIAIYRGASGLWAIKNFSRFYFGSEGDLPVSADYNGDGPSDTAVFRPQSGLWAVRGITRVYFGTQGDIPLPRDCDEDGTADCLIFRPSSGLWSARGISRKYFGSGLDFPVPAKYEDGVVNIGIFRPSNGLWAIADLSRFYFGSPGDLPVPADYDGNGTVDAGVYRPGSGLWAIRGVTRIYYGTEGDQPVPIDADGDGTVDPTIYRPGSGLWAVRGVTRVYYGTEGDFPASR